MKHLFALGLSLESATQRFQEQGAINCIVIAPGSTVNTLDVFEFVSEVSHCQALIYSDSNNPQDDVIVVRIGHNAEQHSISRRDLSRQLDLNRARNGSDHIAQLTR